MHLTENATLYFLLMTLIPLIGLSTNVLLFKHPVMGSRIATVGVWLGFMCSIAAWFIDLPFSEKNEAWGFIANELSWLMAALILFVSAVVHHFSLRYMEGDRMYRRYFLCLNLVTISTLLMVAADNVIILISFWLLSNLGLALLMMHKWQWRAAKNSGRLAVKTFAAGLVFLSIGTGYLAYQSGSLSLSFIGQHSEQLSDSTRTIALFCIILAAMSQSGCWPFHRWLISSLNSPTPVSALMHAGLVNGGGLILARFAPILLHESILLNILFVLAVITLILGGIWKLIQSNVKRMLACSTMTQMGFMMMQCGLGLFPAALTHLCWHGLFKAYLFLRSGSTIAEQSSTDEERVSTIPAFLLSSLCGAIGASGFIYGSGLSFTLSDTTFVLIVFSWMASTQIAHTVLENKQSLLLMLSANVLCLAAGILYGLTVNVIERAVAPLGISQPQAVNPIHLIAVVVICSVWIALNLKPFTNHEGSLWWRRFYVSMLNASQPNPDTTTSDRSGYTS